MDPNNPLVARVAVNRLWAQLFGIGLVETEEDLGTQGDPPSPPELLDWLACEFMDSKWDVKHMVRTIVLSRTYRQVSTASKPLQERDPANRTLARQSRFRLDAELVRDNALRIAGLLAPKIGGPSVKPYQPDGYWENLNFPTRTWVADTGESQYRRGLYTWWQRSFPHPSLLVFDAPSREECAADHLAGDHLLRQVSDVLRPSVRVFDVCTRYGGEGVAILMPGSGLQNGLLVAERIRQRVEAASREVGPRPPHMRVTEAFGLAVLAEDGSPQEFIARADRALYRAKAEGKNRVRYES